MAPIEGDPVSPIESSGTIENISAEGNLTVRLEKGRTVEVNASENRHFDHGYAVTSHSAQGLTADRVLINVDANAHPDLINSRFAYVAVSRARNDAQIFTNDQTALDVVLGKDSSKTAARDASIPDPAIWQQVDLDAAPE